MPADLHYPRRIACLSTETVEVLYALGQQERIVGISGFTVFPPQARREKPKVSGFSSARVDKILAVQPDLVLAFSNLQADIVKECVRAGLPVHVFNQRDLAGIFDMIATLARLTDTKTQGRALIHNLEQSLHAVRVRSAHWKRKPPLYFEEWNDPLITGIRWVSELIDVAGGVDVFSDIARQQSAAERTVQPAQVLHARPEIIVGSWCGKKFQPAHVAQRPGWSDLPAVRDGLVFEIKSAEILSPGISAITRGLPQLVACIARWKQVHEQ